MSKRNVSVIGLGYVGLPVAVEFGFSSKVVGFDVNEKRISELKEGLDKNLEVTKDELAKAKIDFTNQPQDLKSADFHIITVPTPITNANIPDLSIVEKASQTIGEVLKKGDIVVYESTVYPGVTEDICIPILEKVSGLKFGADFTVGYSPERINPGDKEHSFTKIKKVVSGSDEKTLDIIAQTYESVVTAGVFKASSIKVAEAAKVIENTQRDINIAFMNELSIIFDKLDINTRDVLKAASTKWNFLNFYPGLVGGHCIGVDPYYLTYKAESVGYHSDVILSGRRINDSMGKRIAHKTVKELIKSGHKITDSTVTILGLTFKENTPDTRNSRVVDIVNELEEYGINVQVHDPMAYSEEAEREYNIKLKSISELKPANAIIHAVKHRNFLELTTQDMIEMMAKDNSVFVNINGHIEKNDWKGSSVKTWYL